MSEKILEITGIIEEIIYRNEQNGYTVFEVADGDDAITAVGTMPQIGQGDSVKLTGFFTNHRNYGRQFSVQVCEICRPTESADILRYLSSGAIKGIGPSTAQRLVSQLGEKTLDIMENEPERIAAFKGISLDKAKSFSQQLKTNVGVRKLMIYLSEYGISNSSAFKIYNALGPECVARIKKNPYILCQGGFSVSFESADFIAKRENLEHDSGIRLRAGLVYVLKHNEQNGHTCLPREQLAKVTADFLEVPLELVQGCLDEMTFERSLISDNIGEKEFIFTPELRLSEMYISSRIKMLIGFDCEKIGDVEKEIKECEKADGIEYADLQKQAIKTALTEGILVMTGGPGTGKTTTLNAIIQILKRNGKKVSLAAPTGRAAQRMSEVTGSEAKTLHRLLEVSWDKSDTPYFNRNETNQLKCDALIVDEMSMVDTYIFESVVRALPVGCRLILVGDSDQLPSVGPGNVLSDLIESGILPVVKLNEIFRQAQKSLIVTNAHKIVQGEMPVLTDSDNDFFFMLRNGKEEISDTVCELCASRLPKAYGYTVFDNLQVLSPTRKGELGTVELNKKLQNTLNPKSDEKAEVTLGSKTFREGDKVMQTKNNYDIRWFKDDGETGEGIFNGDIGIIQKIDRRAKNIKIRFDDRTANFNYENASELDFAYVITVHKSQGNEFDAVIIPMFNGAPQLSYRNLLYTAVTRAKKTLILVGRPSVVQQMVNNDRRTKRYSGLKEFLQRDDGLY